ncbi:MAG: hypothetical protein AAFN09_02415 [Pseudomonadota bacterium]
MDAQLQVIPRNFQITFAYRCGVKAIELRKRLPRNFAEAPGHP